MDLLILGYSFAAALAIAAGVVVLFSKSIDDAVTRVVPAEMAPAWCQYVRFALFTATFVGGMRLPELAQLITMRPSSGPPISAGQGLLEVLKTMGGSLIAASGTLLVIFVAALAIDASKRFYSTYRASAEKKAALRPHIPERAPAADERKPAVVEQKPAAKAYQPHPAAKARPGTEEPGRFL